jgi:hypothetical protein
MHESTTADKFQLGGNEDRKVISIFVFVLTGDRIAFPISQP